MRINSVKKGRLYEDQLVEEGVGRRQPFSGALSCAKEDLLGINYFFSYLIQAKNASGQASYSIKKKDLLNLRKNSLTIGRKGLFFLNFGDRMEYILISRKEFENLLGAENGREGNKDSAAD